MWRLLELGVINTIIGGIASVIALLPVTLGLGGCAALVGASIFLWLVNVLLDLLAFLLPPFCNFNPLAPATFGPFRPPPRRPRRDPFRRRMALQQAREARSEPASLSMAIPASPSPPPAPICNKRGRDCGCGRR